MPREHERTQYFTEISLESASGKREARISDVSLGGCFVDTITNGDRLDIKGKVAYVMGGFGFGVEFTELDGDSEAVLKKIIENS
jgi:hypothetical protein